MVSTPFSHSTPKFRFRRIRTISASGTSMPRISFTFAAAAWITLRSLEAPALTSKWEELTLATPRVCTRFSALAMPHSTEYSSMPFSNLAAASEWSPSPLAVLRTLSLRNLADSKSTSLVFSVISLFKPPMTPARPTAFSLSQIKRLLASRFLFFPSSVTSSSP